MSMGQKGNISGRYCNTVHLLLCKMSDCSTRTRMARYKWYAVLLYASCQARRRHKQMTIKQRTCVAGQQYQCLAAVQTNK